MADLEEEFFAEDLKLMSAATNYLSWQVNIISPYLGGNQLEIGAGIGNFSVEMAKRCVNHVAIEPDDFCFSNLSEKIEGIDNIKALKIMSEQLSECVNIDLNFNTIIALNVLEHIEDDTQAVKSWSELLANDGKVVLLVPAGERLYGDIDKRLHHYRRYSKQSVKKLAADAGLEIVKLRYMNFIGLMGWWWNARVTKRTSQDEKQIFIFDKLIVPWLSILEKIIPPPVGQSLFVVLQK